MKTNRSKKSKNEKTVVLSAADISKFGMGVLARALKVVDTAKQSKLTIKLEKA